jgi:2'-5' RNA ligase
MLYFDTEGWSKFVESIVDEKDLYVSEDEDSKDQYGYEKEKHTTILYGFHDYKDIAKDIKEYLIPLEDLDDIEMKDVSIFENEKYDVVKIDVKSNKLNKLNKAMTDNFEYTTEHKTYHAHMTVAYVKKGEGKKYEQELDEDALKPIKYVYSDPDRKHTTIKV